MPTFSLQPLKERDHVMKETWGAGEGDLSVQNFTLDILHNAKNLKDIRIEDIILDGTISRTMEGASNITVDVHDPLGKLLNSGAFDRAIDVDFDGLTWRLVAVNKNDSEIELIFEDLDVAYIRSHKEVKHAKHKKGFTRAEFCVWLISMVKAKKIYVVCPELTKIQPTAITAKQRRKERREIRDRRREAGIVNSGDLQVWYKGGVRGGAQEGTWHDTTLSWYAPSLGGINADSTPGTYADGSHVDEDHDMACAAPANFAFGTQIEFEWQGNRVVCQVRDRGGAIQGKRFDLIFHAAQKLGIISAGMAPARYRVVSKDHTALGERGGHVKSATNKQVDLAESIMDVAIEKKCGRKVQIALMAAAMARTSLHNWDEQSSHDGFGPFGLHPTDGWGSKSDLQDVETIGKKIIYQLKVANRGQPDITIQELVALAIHGTSKNDVYAAIPYAKAMVEGYGAANIKAIAYRRLVVWSTRNGGKAEDWWTTIGRLMTEVGWARFMANGVLYLISEHDLLQGRVRMKISEHTPGVDTINFNYDVGKKIANAEVVCRADRWIAPPGSVIELMKSGPANGRWLVSEITRPIKSRDCTITLKKPTPELPEPLGDLVLRDNADTNISSTTPGGTGGRGGGSGSNKVIVDPTANLPNKPIKSEFMKFLRAVSAYTNEEIRVVTGTNHNEYVAGTNSISNHFYGNAADLNVDGDANSSSHASVKGDHIVIAALRACGLSYAAARAKVRAKGGHFNFDENFTWKGHSVEIGWKTYVGGNHYNHVHLGFDS